MESELHIDVYFDLVCPWCLIGKAQLARARQKWAQTWPEVPVSVHWHSVQLLPHVPQEGWPFKAFYLQRLGSEAMVQRRQAQVREAATAAGVGVAFERIQTFPNTRLAHALVQAVQQDGEGALEPLLDQLFDGYFSQGAQLGDRQTLRMVAERAGVPPAVTERALACGKLPPALPGLEGQGVPLFVFNGGHAVPGAQPAEVLFHAMCSSLGFESPDGQRVIS